MSRVPPAFHASLPLPSRHLFSYLSTTCNRPFQSRVHSSRAAVMSATNETPPDAVSPLPPTVKLSTTTPLPPPPPPPPDGFFERVRASLSQRGALKTEALRTYGVAALLSYGLFDALTYSVSFLLAVRAFLAAGKVLSWSTLPQVLALMWGVNNLSRPFRIAGALALAPVMDRKVVKPVGGWFRKMWGKSDGERSE